VLKIAFFKGSS